MNSSSEVWVDVYLMPRWRGVRRVRGMWSVGRWRSHVGWEATSSHVSKPSTLHRSAASDRPESIPHTAPPSPSSSPSHPHVLRPFRQYCSNLIYNRSLHNNSVMVKDRIMYTHLDTRCVVYCRSLPLLKI